MQNKTKQKKRKYQPLPLFHLRLFLIAGNSNPSGDSPTSTSGQRASARLPFVFTSDAEPGLPTAALSSWRYMDACVGSGGSVNLRSSRLVSDVTGSAARRRPSRRLRRRSILEHARTPRDSRLPNAGRRGESTERRAGGRRKRLVDLRS